MSHLDEIKQVQAMLAVAPAEQWVDWIDAALQQIRARPTLLLGWSIESQAWMLFLQKGHPDRYEDNAWLQLATRDQSDLFQCARALSAWHEIDPDPALVEYEMARLLATAK